MQLLPCLHSKSSFESQFLESQNLFSSLKLHYAWFPGQPQRTCFNTSHALHSSITCDTLKQYSFWFCGKFSPWDVINSFSLSMQLDIGRWILHLPKGSHIFVAVNLQLVSPSLLPVLCLRAPLLYRSFYQHTVEHLKASLLWCREQRLTATPNSRIWPLPVNNVI